MIFPLRHLKSEKAQKRTSTSSNREGALGDAVSFTIPLQKVQEQLSVKDL
jgi:hypothetical protein